MYKDTSLKSIVRKGTRQNVRYKQNYACTPEMLNKKVVYYVYNLPFVVIKLKINAEWSSNCCLKLVFNYDSMSIDLVPSGMTSAPDCIHIRLISSKLL